FITGKGSIQVKLYCLDNEHLMRTVYDKVLAIPGISATETIISLREVFRRPLAVEFIEDQPAKKR
ncbi:MAG: Lrp/AsnC ligand binding domain-containing protein, partial [Alistipes sp.]|nr:Lrp/AsnC ligand binding domain-containing protein [Alistipes sp.]